MARVAGLVSLASACGSSVSGLGTEQPLLATVRGQVTAPDGRPGVALRVGVLWSGVPVFVPYCHAYGPTPLDPGRRIPGPAAEGCTDPFAVVPGVMGPSVPLDPSGAFAIPIRQVPPATVMVGVPESRVAYGSIVVFADQDGDGDLDFPRSCRGGGGGPGNNGSADAAVSSAADAGSELDPEDLEDEAERRGEALYGDSFHTLTSTGIRVVYVEGSLDTSSYYYPAPAGCTEVPPAGFSTWLTGSTLDPHASCRVRDIGEPVEIVARAAPDLDSTLRCVPGDRQTFPRELNERSGANLLDLTRFTVDCLDDGTFVVVDRRCTCREVRTYPLAGCRDEVDCPVPEWDLRADPPEWWPCEQRFGP